MNSFTVKAFIMQLPLILMCIFVQSSYGLAMVDITFQNKSSEEIIINRVSTYGGSKITPCPFWKNDDKTFKIKSFGSYKVIIDVTNCLEWETFTAWFYLQGTKSYIKFVYSTGIGGYTIKLKNFPAKINLKNIDASYGDGLWSGYTVIFTNMKK